MEIRCDSENCSYQANGECCIISAYIDSKQKCLSYEKRSICKPKEKPKKKGGAMEIISISATVNLKDGRTVFLSADDPEHLANQIQELAEQEIDYEDVPDLSSIDLERR